MNIQMLRVRRIPAVKFDAQGTRVSICRPDAGFTAHDRGICKIPEVLIT